MIKYFCKIHIVTWRNEIIKSYNFYGYKSNLRLITMKVALMNEVLRDYK